MSRDRPSPAAPVDAAIRAVLDTATQAEIRLLDAIDNLGEGIALWNAEDRLITCNRRHYELFLAARELFVAGRSCAEILRQAQAEGLLPLAEAELEAWLEARGTGHDPAPLELGFPNGKFLRVSDHRTRDGGTVTLSVDFSEAQAREELLRSSENFLRLVIDCIPHYVLWKNRDSVYLGCNQRFAEAVGLAEAAAIAGMTDRQLAGRSRMADILKADEQRMMAADQTVFDREDELPLAEGGTFWGRTAMVPLHDGDGAVVGLLITIEDITERRRAEAVRAAGERLLRSVLEASPSGVAITRPKGGEIVFANHRLGELLDLAHDRLIGAAMADFYAEDDAHATLVAAVEQDNRLTDAEVARKRADGTVFWSLTSIEPVFYEGAPAHLSWIHDISARKAEEEKLQRLALHDSLTGLANRTSFNLHLDDALRAARSRGWHGALMFVDLDGFKEVNDRLGHEFGDQLLREVAARLSRSVRGSDVVARLGGDEFVILLREIGDRENAERVTAKVLDALGRPYRGPAGEARVTASIGLTFFSADQRRPELLFREADTAMYRAKRSGKNRYAIFDRDAAA